MSIPPQPYPAQYGPPLGYASPSQIGMSAKWAGILLIVLGVVAMLMGGCATAMGAVLPTLMESPEVQRDQDVQRMFQELSKGGTTPDVLFYVVGGVLLAYALTMVVTGIVLVRARNRGPVTAGIVIVSIVLVLSGLQVIGALLQGNVPALLMMLIFSGLHALVVFWLTQARRAGPQMPTMPSGYPGYSYPPPPPPQPMQGYYHDPK